MWCWRRLLRVSWATMRSNQSILKGINPEYSFEGLLRKLKLQSFGHLMQRADLLEKTLMLGKIADRKRRGWQKMRWLDGITNFIIDMSLRKLQETVKGRLACCHPLGSQRVGHNWVTEQGTTKTALQCCIGCISLHADSLVNMHQPQVHICSCPLEPPSYLPPHPAPLGHCRPPGWALCVTQRLPISRPFHMW